MFLVMNTVLILLMVLFVAYNLFLSCKFGIPHSLSETSYIWKTYNNKPYMFSLLCGITGGTLLPSWLLASSEDYQFLVFLSCTGLIFSGVSPMFRGGIDKPVHYTSAIAAMICFTLWLVLVQVWWLVICLVLTVLLSFLFDKRRIVYWVEVVTFMGIIIHLLKYHW